jgi:hypothetical protein
MDVWEVPQSSRSGLDRGFLMDVWEVAQSSRSGLDRGFLMDVGPTRAR